MDTQGLPAVRGFRGVNAVPELPELKPEVRAALERYRARRKSHEPVWMVDQTILAAAFAALYPEPETP